jgi:acyl-coenzyme A thioesterase PaaI-like protein
MEIKTHTDVDPKYLGTPVLIEDDREAEVELMALGEMAVDGKGLIHGGFTFGLADYAAMLAVNHPNVVLGGAECNFLAPVRVGDLMKARAVVTRVKGGRRKVDVDICVDDRKVFSGIFDCHVLCRHVLDR